MRAYTDIGRFLAMFENGKAGLSTCLLCWKTEGWIIALMWSIPAFAEPPRGSNRTPSTVALPLNKCRSTRQWLNCSFT